VAGRSCGRCPPYEVVGRVYYELVDDAHPTRSWDVLTTNRWAMPTLRRGRAYAAPESRFWPGAVSVLRSFGSGFWFLVSSRKGEMVR